MADLRIPRTPQPPATVPAAPVRPSVRAAQQAFFRQAMASEQVRPAAPQQAMQPAAKPATDAPASERLLRPGSFVDIKV